MSADVTIRHLDQSLLETMLDWAAEEGWNPGLGDAAAFFAADPDGFLGLFVGSELTATISTVRYDAHFAFVGFYICRPDRRGEGLGLRLFETSLADIDATTVGLDAVVEQERNYAWSGFVTAHRNVRYGGRPDVKALDDGRVRALGSDDVETLIEYERGAAVFPAHRPRFLERWLTARGTHAFAISDGDAIDGYGVIRRCRSGHKIGPLFCHNAADAKLLFAALVHTIDGDDAVFLDVPQPNTTAMEFARDMGLDTTFETARMYRGPDPAIALDSVFGITTFELG